VAGAVASAATTAVTQTAGKLISTMNMDHFRYLLIRWIVMMNIALACVESPLFSNFGLYLPNAEMTLDLEANEVEVKVLTSLVSVTESTALTVRVNVVLEKLDPTLALLARSSCPFSLLFLT
jgi:hypothetical protein